MSNLRNCRICSVYSHDLDIWLLCNLQGSYSLKMTMEDGNKKQLSCISFDFSIGFFAEENLAVM